MFIILKSDKQTKIEWYGW